MTVEACHGTNDRASSSRSLVPQVTTVHAVVEVDLAERLRIFFRKYLFKNLRTGGVHHLIPSDVMLDRDAGIRVAEQVRRQIDVPVQVHRGRNGPAEHVRADALDARQIHHLFQLRPHVVWCEGGAVPAGEQQRVQRFVGQRCQPPADGFRGEGRHDHGPAGFGGLGMVLPGRCNSPWADDGAGDSDDRLPGGDVHIPAAERQHFPDAGGGAEHDFHDRPQLFVGFWSRGAEPGFPVSDGVSHGVDLDGGERGRDRRWPAEATDGFHRVPHQNFVANGEAERLTEDIPGVDGAAGADEALLFDEQVTSRHPNFSQGQVGKVRQHQLFHVPPVKLFRVVGPAASVHIGEPVVGEGAEEAVGVQVAGSGLVHVAGGTLLLESVFCRPGGGAGRLNLAAEPIPIPKQRPGPVFAGWGASDGDITERADCQAHSRHG